MYKINKNKIDFFWDTDRIFDLVSYKTGIQAKNMVQSGKDEDQKVEMDYIVTDDDKEYVQEELRPIFVRLYEFFLDVAYPEENVLYVSRPDATLGIFLSGFSVKSNHNVVGEMLIREQRLNVISSLCQEYIVAQVVSRWGLDNRLSEFRDANVEEIAKIEAKLKKNIVYLKKRAFVNSFS